MVVGRKMRKKVAIRRRVGETWNWFKSSSPSACSTGHGAGDHVAQLRQGLLQVHCVRRSVSISVRTPTFKRLKLWRGSWFAARGCISSKALSQATSELGREPQRRVGWNKRLREGMGYPLGKLMN